MTQEASRSLLPCAMGVVVQPDEPSLRLELERNSGTASSQDSVYRRQGFPWQG